MNDMERPFDHLISDAGLCRIFRTFACVGDSLSSGEFESMNEEGTKGYHDMFEYSWGQFMARSMGSLCYNFSRGGMTAKEYVESFAEAKGFWDQDKRCQAYILALGVNDMNRDCLGELSDICVEDWHKNKPTFAGYYGTIIQRYKEIEPRAKFFLMTMPRDPKRPKEKDERCHRHAALLRDLPSLFENTYVLDFEQYAPIYDQAFRDAYYMGGHMAPAGYILTAQYVMSYIDYIIRHNMADFKEVPFIGTNLHSEAFFAQKENTEK